MTCRPPLFIVLAIAATAVAGCTDDRSSDSGVDTNHTTQLDASHDGDAGDDANSNDADVTPLQDVEEPDAGAAAPDAQADLSDWEDEFDFDDKETSDDADLYVGPDDRPARVLLPDSYDGSESFPVVFLFHGFTANSGLMDAYFDLSSRRHEREFIIVLPDGLRNPTGQRYWNATDFCCDMYDEGPDDVGYFEQLLDDVLQTLAADPDRIHLMGHSNGHFFSHRLACEHGSRIASVVGFAGGGHWDADDCPEDGTLSMLHIHGTNDALVLYGGAIGLYPGARTMAERWSERNDCSDSSSIYGYTSLAALIWGTETVQRRWQDCPQGIDVELWTIMGGSHTPVFVSSFADRVLDFALPRTNPDAP